MAKSYNQYCPVARALDLVGERWSLLVIRELVEHGPLRYSDLHAHLDHCGTNILAARLKDLESGGVIRRRQLPPPAASTIYELTEYGEGLRRVLHELAHWGARSLGPPRAKSDLEPGWLEGALRVALPPSFPGLSVEFRIGGEVASLVEGHVREGPCERSDAIVEGDAADLFRFFVDRDLAAVKVRGSKAAARALLEALPTPPPDPTFRPRAAA